MSKIKLTVFSDSELCLRDKKSYVSKLYPHMSGDKFNCGFAQKFNNAYGYKDVDIQTIASGTYKPPKIESPESYRSPNSLFYDCYINISDKRVAFELVFDNVEMVHPISRYSYKTESIAIDIKKFLEKVFKSVTVVISTIDNFELSVRDYALSYFFINLKEELSVTLEFSSTTLMSDNDKRLVEGYLREVYPNPIRVNQFRCDSCEVNSNGLTPYHIEVEYL